jgi:hypothetical protein
MRFGRVLLVPAALVAAGCIQGQRTIKVNADGSGTITDTVTLGEQAREMMSAMSEMDKSTPAEKKAKKDAKLKSLADAMGPGVTVAAFEPSVKDGPEKVTYAFKDISKLKIDITPDMTEGDSKQEAKEPLTFRFEKKGGNSVVTVLGAGPKPGEKKAEKPADEGGKEGAEAAAKMQAQAMVMMKTMMKGLKMTTVVEVNGKIVKTNAAHVEGPRVTLLDMDFDQIAADEANFKKFSAAGDDPKTMDPKMLEGLKGIKVQTVPEVSIEFGK